MVSGLLSSGGALTIRRRISSAVEPFLTSIFAFSSLSSIRSANGCASRSARAMTLTYYVALPFRRADDGGTVPGEAMECQNSGAAILLAEALSQIQGNVAAVAFSRSGVP